MAERETVVVQRISLGPWFDSGWRIFHALDSIPGGVMFHALSREGPARVSGPKEPCEPVGPPSPHLFLMRLLGPTTSSAQNIFLIRFLSQVFCGFFLDEKCGDLGESPGTLTTSDAGCIRKSKSALGARKKKPCALNIPIYRMLGWLSLPVERRSHNPKVASSILAPGISLF